MGLYKIIDITEADFGCEERLDGAHAMLEIDENLPKAVDWLPADMSLSDERVNDLYKWIEDVKK